MTHTHASTLTFPSGLRSDQFMVVGGRVRPVVAGAAESDPPIPPPAPPVLSPTPDLDALQTALDIAAKTSGSKATTDLLAALGFEDLDKATEFVTAARTKAEGEKSDLQKAREAQARAELALTQAQTQAVAAERARLVERALVAKGAAPAQVERLTRLVDVPDGADEATVGAEVDKLATEFPAVFTSTGTPVPPSGASGAKPPPSPSGAKTAYQRGQDRWKAQHEKAS